MHTHAQASIHTFVRALARAQTVASVDTAMFHLQTDLATAKYRQDVYIAALHVGRVLAQKRKDVLTAHAMQKAALPRRLAQFYPETV